MIGRENIKDILLVVLVFAVLLVFAVVLDIRRAVGRVSDDNKAGIELIRRDFTRYLTTGECGQFIDNKNQLKEGAGK